MNTKRAIQFLLASAILLTQQNCTTAAKAKRHSPPSDGASTNAQEGVLAAGELVQELKAGLLPGQVWTNSLGMEFVPVPETAVLICRWETRVKDFEEFVKATGHDATRGMYSFRKGNWVQNDDTWKNPGFAQDGTHPVVGVSWNDARAFCKWLTGRERKSGRLKGGQEYRLPSDREWSRSAGLKEDVEGTSTNDGGSAKGVYPWGREWPPPKDAGNYAGSEAKDPGWRLTPIEGYRDDYPRTAPVGSFRANDLGVCDLGGNAWEWCVDKAGGDRILRGGSWHDSSREDLLLSRRNHFDPGARFSDCGFRIAVVAAAGADATERTAPRTAGGGQPLQVWTNSLGMEFVAVPGTEVLFCRRETRVRDFEAFVKDTNHDATNGVYSLTKGKWIRKGDKWKSPGFGQGGVYPAVGVNWGDAQAFCRWLTEKERGTGRLKAGQEYRLPRDWEWSAAAGLQEDRNLAPSEKNGKIEEVYPWGRDWPPPDDAGNYAGKEARDADWIWAPIEGFRDKYPRTAPVGSFRANGFGIFDLGGNAWEWCEDFYSGTNGNRVLRGGSWDNGGPRSLLSSCHLECDPEMRIVTVGFRVVVTPPAAVRKD